MKRTPLRRKAPMRRRRKSTSYSRRERNFDYMIAVKGLPCAASPMSTWHPSSCDGPVEADHAGLRGMSQKCDDEETIPLCTYHHKCRTEMSGPFGEFDRPSMRAWLDACIATTQRLLHHLRAPKGETC